jgi:glucosamine kinase
MPIQIIADSGASTTNWCILDGKTKKKITTAGISPYLLTSDQIVALLQKELLPKIKNVQPAVVHYYGTGCISPVNVQIVKKALSKLFGGASIYVNHDMLSAARALCGKQKGMVVNFGTGSFCCYYNGKNIARQTAGIGYVLGDEGSGAYLGKKVIQYYLYETFDEDLRARFDAAYHTSRAEILEKVYRQPLPNRYMASYTMFLAENRGHFMVENIIEDSFNESFFTHLYKYKESWTLPIHFIGSVAYGFKDVLKEMCSNYELQLGKVLKTPMEGLIQYHTS